MKIGTIASVVCLAFATAFAQAQVTIEQKPGHPQGDENVLYNGSGLIENGFTVQGQTNQTQTIVDFTSSTSLSADGGQAKIRAGNRGDFSDLLVKLDNGGTFTSLVWNLNAVSNGPVTFNVDTNKGDFSESFDLKKNGQNFFQILADSGVSITSASFESNVGISDVKQVRIGGCNAPAPEPASLLGLGLGAVAVLRRRKLAKK